MNKLLPALVTVCSFGIILHAQDPIGPPPGGQEQKQQAPDLLIPLSTKIVSLVFRVNGRD